MTGSVLKPHLPGGNPKVAREYPSTSHRNVLRCGLSAFVEVKALIDQNWKTFRGSYDLTFADCHPACQYQRDFIAKIQYDRDTRQSPSRTRSDDGRFEPGIDTDQ